MATLIRIERDENGKLTGYEVTGHSGFAESGEDIVCAAISAIVQTAALGFSEVLSLSVEHRMEDGYFALKLPVIQEKSLREKADVIADTMLTGLRNLESDYGSFMTVLDREV